MVGPLELSKLAVHLRGVCARVLGRPPSDVAFLTWDESEFVNLEDFFASAPVLATPALYQGPICSEENVDERQLCCTS